MKIIYLRTHLLLVYSSLEMILLLLRIRLILLKKGTFFPRDTKGIVRRAIRGMIRDKRYHGREAFKRQSIVSEEFTNENLVLVLRKLN